MLADFFSILFKGSRREWWIGSMAKARFDGEDRGGCVLSRSGWRLVSVQSKVEGRAWSEPRSMLDQLWDSES